MNKKLIVVIVVLLAVIAGGAALFIAKGSVSIESAEKIDFVEAVKAYQRNDDSFSALNTKYVGKVVEFAGDFSELRSVQPIEAKFVGFDDTNKFCATIKYNTKVPGWGEWAKKPSDSIVCAMCYLASGQEKKLQDLQIGTEVIMHGTLVELGSGMISRSDPGFEAIFKDCKVVRCK